MFDFLHAYNIVKSKDDMPSRSSISTTALIDVCESFEEELKKFFTKINIKSIATAYDLWTDSHGHRNYLNLSVQVIDKAWNLHCVNLGTDLLERPHLAVRIEEHIEKKLIQFGLHEMINVSVKDNGANVVACARNMAIKTGLTKENLDDFECVAHDLHLLIMKDVLGDEEHEELRELLKKVKSTHRALTYKLPDLRKQTIEDQSLQLQEFYKKLDEQIAEILEIEDDDEVVEVHTRAPTIIPPVAFKNSNDTRWDSTRILLKTRRENEGELLIFFRNIW